MTKLTDSYSVRDDSLTAKEQNEAFRKAWLANTEVRLLERKTKFSPPSWLI